MSKLTRTAPKGNSAPTDGDGASRRKDRKDKAFHIKCSAQMRDEFHAACQAFGKESSDVIRDFVLQVIADHKAGSK